MPAKWTLERFLERAAEVHGDKYDYSEVTREHIKGYASKVPLRCNTCGYRWEPSINHHINSKSGCLDCAGKAPWTLERFLGKAAEIHGNKFDYSLITKEHIKGWTSNIPVICRICDYEWFPAIHSHINSKQGCPNCSGRARWTLERFLEKAKEIHGDKFDYSEVTEEHIKTNKSNIPITCLMCGYRWSPSLSSHINQKQGCSGCSGNVPWTLERFLQRAKEIHGDKFDYSEVTEGHIKGKRSKIPITCYICNYQWSPSIESHINLKSGCPDCAGLAKYTLNRFLQRAKEIHGDKFDYSEITEEHIQNNKSDIPITCLMCGYRWSPIINNHLSGFGCPDCAGLAKYTLERFLERAKEVHDNKYDYSEVTEEHIRNSHVKVPLTCRKCGYRWTPLIYQHLNYKTGCPNCVGHAKYTLKRFLQRAKEVHDNKYDYSEVTEDHINGKDSKIPIICKRCNHHWSPKIESHINGKTGCPVCRSSHGERECQRILDECGLDYQKEVILPELPKRRFDFAFDYEDHLYLLEFDGIQHFEKNTFHHRHEGAFEERQEIDLLKTRAVLERNATLIRIDYTQIDNIYDHIYRAIEEGSNLYLSTPEMYTYITDRL